MLRDATHPYLLLVALCFGLTQTTALARAAEQVVSETSEYHGINALIVSLATAEAARWRLGDMDPKALEKTLNLKEKAFLISDYTKRMQLAINDLLNAQYQLPQWSGPPQSQNDPMKKGVEGLAAAYKGLITDYSGLILEYHKKLPNPRPHEDSASKKHKGPPTLPTQAAHERSPSHRHGKFEEASQTPRTMEQLQTDIEKGWDSILESCLAIAHALVSDRTGNLIVTASQRDDLLWEMNALLPQAKEGTNPGHSKVIAGAAAIRNLLREVPSKPDFSGHGSVS